jgi:hypothetical protein
VAIQREKLYTANTTESIHFRDPAGNQGQATLNITRIDHSLPQAIAVMYSPATTTNGNVLATLITDKPVTLLGSGRTPSGVIASGTQGDLALQRTKTFTDNT